MIWLAAIIILPLVIGYFTYKLTLNKLERDRFYRHINGLPDVTNSGSPGMSINQYIICLKNGKVHYEFGRNWMSIAKTIPQDTRPSRRRRTGDGAGHGWCRRCRWRQGRGA